MKKLLLSLVLILPVIAVPQAAQAAAKVTVSPAKVWPRVAPCSGTNDFTVSGKGFDPYEKIALTVGGLAYDAFHADATGRYEETTEIKALPSGTYDVELTGAEGNEASSEIYVGWAGCWERENRDLTVRGAGFAAGGRVEVLLDGEPETVLASPRGRFEAELNCPKGKHTLAVAGPRHGLDFGTINC